MDADLAVVINVKVLFLLHSVELVEIFITQDGKFLDITRVPEQLKLRSGLEKYLYIRDCYELIIADIVESLPIKKRKTVAILGTAGIGKSSLFMVVLKLLIEDPTKFELSTRSFYFQTVPGEIWLYRHEHANKFSVHKCERLDASIPLFADMETMQGPKEHAGISLIFTSFCPSRYYELTKKGWHKVMPTWSADEQADLFSSAQFQSKRGKEVAQRAYGNILYLGGSIELAITGRSPKMKIDDAIINMGEYVCKQFFEVGFGGRGDVLSDCLEHRNPIITGDSYDFDAVPCTQRQHTGH